ncbi:heavy-metal-associated domain-containing protein, partial [Haloferax profundi]|uniref:heavy-metal-associated domain-containing protein n=1 Tax=Haloferax profundi TaxID=1544718 RepID=UPI000B08F0E2
MSEHDGRVTDDPDTSTNPPDDCGCDDACDVDSEAGSQSVGVTDPDAARSRAEFGVPDMDCPSCAGKVESSVRRLDGIGDIDPQVTTGRLVVDYDPGRTSIDDIRASIEGAGYAVEDEPAVRTVTLTVPDMDCPSCAGKVENALETVSGVLDYDTRPTTGTAIVTVAADTDPADV